MGHIILISLLLTALAWPAEILIRAQSHWMETADTTGWTQEQLDEKHQVTTKGSPIVVKPDRFLWGNRERAPWNIIVRLAWADTTRPEITPHQIGYYIQALRDSTGRTIKVAKYKVPEVLVDSVLNYHGGFVQMTPAKLLNVIKEYKQDSGWE